MLTTQQRLEAQARLLRVKYLMRDVFTETRAQLDELAQQAEGSHRQHMEGSGE